MSDKICCIFNYPPHYRKPILTLMDHELKCDFYFGDKVESQIQKMDYSLLAGFKKILKNRPLWNTGFRWQKGAVSLIFKPYKYFLITGEPAYVSSWLLILLSKFTGKKVFAWTHGLKKPVETKGEKLQKMFFKLCDTLLLYGEYGKNIMLEEGFSKDKLVPIFNSLDYDRQLALRDKLTSKDLYSDHFGNKFPVIIYIGRLQNSKKLDQLVKAIQILFKNGQPCNLVLVGKEVEPTPLHRMVSEFEIENRIWFYGPCYEEDQIGKLLYNADVCVSPGPVGLTAIHALSYGCPVISNDHFETQMPEHEVIRPGKTGAFFKQDDIESLATTIEQWIGLDTQNREVIRKEAYQIIDETWNPNYQIQVLKSIFKSH